MSQAGKTVREMVEETQAMARKLLKENPEGYPAVTPPRPPLKHVFHHNVIVCVHGRRVKESGGSRNIELLVEWSLPPEGTNRLTWIPETEACRLAPPEVKIFRDRERGAGQASARDRMYRGDRAVHPAGMVDAEDEDLLPGTDDGLRKGEALGAETLSVIDGDRDRFDFRNVLALESRSASSADPRHVRVLPGTYVMIVKAEEELVEENLKVGR